jgi:hypothetical protein
VGAASPPLHSAERPPNQERRPSARRGLGWANVIRDVPETHLQARFRNHGWLTPAALDCTTFDRRGNDDFCDMRTHVHKSGGRQPAVAGDTDAILQESSIVRRPTTHDRRAATVSPPWLLGKCTCRNAAAKLWESVDGALTNPRAVAVANPRGAYAPRSHVAVRKFAGEKTIFSMHERTFTRAAGVSPPWLVIPTLYCENRASFGDRRHTTEERRASARRGCGNATATAFVYGRPAGRPCATIVVLPLQARFRNHGWLTPAAPGCTHAHRC